MFTCVSILLFALLYFDISGRNTLLYWEWSVLNLVLILGGRMLLGLILSWVE